VALRRPALHSTGSEWSEPVGEETVIFKRGAVLLRAEEHGKILRYEES
jgi:hypothetical protein